MQGVNRGRTSPEEGATYYLLYLHCTIRSISVKASFTMNIVNREEWLGILVTIKGALKKRLDMMMPRFMLEGAPP